MFRKSPRTVSAEGDDLPLGAIEKKRGKTCQNVKKWEKPQLKMEREKSPNIRR